jgi:hypothetical protein
MPLVKGKTIYKYGRWALVWGGYLILEKIVSSNFLKQINLENLQGLGL